MIPKKIFVTGGRGWIASHLRKQLKATYYEGDIFDLTEKDLKGVDTVIHLAAKLGVKKSWENPEEFFRVNTYGTYHFAQLCAKVGATLVFTSTCVAEQPKSSPYAMSKYLAEEVLFNGGFENTRIRLFNNYGTGWRTSSPNIVSILVKKILAGEEVVIYGDGEQKRDFVFVEDTAEIIKNVAEDAWFGYSFDIGTCVPTTINKLVNTISKVTGKDVKIKVEPARKEASQSVCMDNGMAKTILGREFANLEEGLKVVIKNVSTN